MPATDSEGTVVDSEVVPVFPSGLCEDSDSADLGYPVPSPLRPERLERHSELGIFDAQDLHREYCRVLRPAYRDSGEFDRLFKDVNVMQERLTAPMEASQPTAPVLMDLDKLEKFMLLQEKYEANQARKAYTQAMSDFKKNPPEIPQIMCKIAT